MPVALGGAAGAGLVWTAEVYGATPAALAGALAIACFGAAVGSGRSWAPVVHLGLVAAAVAGLVLGPGLAATLPSTSWLSPDAPTAIGCLTMFAAGLALGAGRVGPGCETSLAGWLAGGAGVVVGALLPTLGLAVALALLGMARWVKMAPAPDPDWRPALGWGALLAWFSAVTVATAGWGVVRASVDPTPGGAAVALAAAAFWVGGGRALRRQVGSPGLPPRSLWVAAAGALVLVVLLGSWPERSWEAIAGSAGKSDPRLWLWALVALAVAPGALACGVVLAPHRSSATARTGLWLATAAGLVLGLDLGPDLRRACLGLAVLVGAIEVWRPTLVGRLRGATLIGVASAVVAVPVPWPEAHLPEGRLAHLQDPDGPGRHKKRVADARLLAAGWGPGGGVVLLGRPDGTLVHVSDGVPLETRGRAADAERMAGHLARALAPRFDRALVLGDSLGLVTAGLVRDLVEQTTVAVPDPEATRAHATVDTALSAAFLHPSVTLARGTTERVVRSTGPQDIIIEVSRVPWTDASRTLPGIRQLRARRELLEPRQGLYLLVVTVTRLNNAALRGLLGDVLAVFPETWAFLPPGGADQLMLASWTGDAKAYWDQFLAVETIALDQLAAIGLGSALDLADRAAVGPSGLAALAEGGRSAHGPWLPGDLHDGPYLGLEMLEPHLEGPGAWLDSGPLETIPSILEARVDAKSRFLRLLGKAARGDTEGVFDESRALLGTEGGQETLDPLMAPYLERAEALLREARAAGLASRSWQKALAELEAARLMNPSSTAVLALQADTHLALGSVDRARSLYDEVLALDPGHLAALMGSAQAALLDDDFGQAETLLREGVQRNVRSWVAHHNLGEFLANAHRYTDAERHLKTAVELSGGNQAAPFAALSTVYLERGEVAASLLQANRALLVQDSAEHRYLVARAHYELGNPSIASTHAQKGALRDPNHLGNHFILGVIQAERGQHDQCMRTFKRVLELQPGNEPALANLRRCAELAGGQGTQEVP